MSRAERVALKSLGRCDLGPAPHMKYGLLLGPNVTSMGRAITYFRKVVKESDDPLARALAKEREYFRDRLRVLFAPHVPLVEGARPPQMLPGGLRHALVIIL